MCRKNSLLKLAVSLLCAVSGVGAFAQSGKITGTVVSAASNEPLLGVTVVVDGNLSNYAVTSADGKFEIQAKMPAVISVSCLGFEGQSIKVTNYSPLVIKLKDDDTLLQDAVVVGFATQKKANLTGAVASVDVNKSLAGRTIPDVGRGLQGAVAGLTVTVPDAEVGSDAKIKIRGAIGSIEGGSSPLILLDNVEIPSLQVVNPDDIESISVLKDAASASIYGSKAAFGVVLITTKKGAKTEKINVNYQGNVSWANLSKSYSVAGINGLQYMMDARAREKDADHTGHYSYDGLYTGSYFRVDMEAIQKAKQHLATYGHMGANVPVVYGRDWEYRSGRIYGIRTYNIYDYIIRENAPSTNHNISVNGRVKKTSFNIGLGYVGQSGMFKDGVDTYKKYNASVKVETDVNKWLRVRGGMMYSLREKRYPFITESGSDGPWIYLYRWSSLMPLGYNEDGEIIRSAQSVIQQSGTQSIKYNYTNVNLGTTLTFTPNWHLNADYTFSNQDYIRTLPGSKLSAASYRDTPVLRYDENGDPIYVNSAGQVVDPSDPEAMRSYKLLWTEDYQKGGKTDLYKRTAENSYRHTFNAYTDYDLDIKDSHIFKFMVGMNLSTYDSSSQWTQVTGLTDYTNPQFAFGTGVWTGGGDASWQSHMGFFGRVNYSYKDKYLLEANIRYDGSSKFPTRLRWKWFPSFSAGWVFTNEGFLQSAKDVLSHGKIRASWGSIGDQTVSSSLYISTLSTSNSNWLGSSGYRFVVGTPSAVSSSITWQTINTLDVGVDLAFFKGQLTLSADWYQRSTLDMIVPSAGINEITFGGSAPMVNTGDLRTRGWEIEIGYNHLFQNGLSINLGASVSDYRTVITRYGSEQGLSDWYVGKEYGEIWGFKVDRLYQKDDFETDINGNLIYRALTPNDTNDPQCLGKMSYILKKGPNGEKPVYQSYYEGSSFKFGPGDVKYVDVDGNGRLERGTRTIGDHGDLVKIGNSTPRYLYSFRLGAAWKGFDINAFFQGVGSRKIWGDGFLCIAGYKYSDGCMPAAIADDYWTESNTDAWWPAAASGSSGSYNFLVNDRYILNMAYLRLKNLTVGYTLPHILTQKISIEKLRVYFTAENLLTFDHLRGLPIDPECETGVSMWGSPQGRTGVGTPNFKTVSAGLQVTF